MSWLPRNKISQKCTRSPFSLDHLNTMKVTIRSHALALVSPDSMLENSIIIREIPILSTTKKTSSWNFIQIAPQWACITTTMAMTGRARDTLRLVLIRFYFFSFNGIFFFAEKHLDRKPSITLTNRSDP